MKKLISLVFIMSAAFGLNAKAIDSFRFTPSVGAAFITGEPDSSFGGSVGVDATAVKSLNEKSDLDFGLGLSFTAPMNFAEAGTPEIEAVSVNGVAIKDVDGSMLPIYAKVGYTYKMENNKSLVADLKLGYAMDISTDQEFKKIDGTFPAITETEQSIDTEGGLYLGASVGYGFGNYVVSLSYQMFGYKVINSTEIEQSGIDMPGSSKEVSSTNHAIGLNLAYKFDVK